MVLIYFVLVVCLIIWISCGFGLGWVCEFVSFCDWLTLLRLLVWFVDYASGYVHVLGLIVGVR